MGLESAWAGELGVAEGGCVRLGAWLSLAEPPFGPSRGSQRLTRPLSLQEAGGSGLCLAGLWGGCS